MRAVLLTCLLMLASLANAAPQKAEIIEFLSKLYSEEQLRAEFAGYGFEGENLEVSVAHVQRVMNDRVIVGRLADQLLAVGQGVVPKSSADGLMLPMLTAGLARLSPRELSYYYKVEATIFEALPKRECGLELKGRLHPRVMNRLMAATTAKLNTAALKDYYAIIYKATRLGATRGKVTLSAAERERRGKLLFEAMQAEAASRPNGEELIRAYETDWRVSNSVACEAGLLLFDAIQKQPAATRHQLLIFLSLE